MEEKQTVNITFNITGGNNQILPNATKAEQHFHLSGTAGQVAPRPERDTPWTEDDIARLGLYVENRDRLNSLVAAGSRGDHRTPSQLPKGSSPSTQGDLGIDPWVPAR